MLHLLAALPRRNEWAFFSPTSATGCLTEPNNPHTRACKAAGLEGLTMHGLRRSFKSLTEWLEVPVGVVAQIQGHKPSATAEKHYTVRPLELLRLHHERIEAWISSRRELCLMPRPRQVGCGQSHENGTKSHNLSTQTYKKLYTLIMKDLEFRGSSLSDLRDFPHTAMRDVGHQLDRVQKGLPPDDAKPMLTIGSGVMELRIWDEAGTFRVVYVAKFEDAVYVLHCFKKKTPQTTQPDIELARKRFKELVKEIPK